MTIEQTRQLAVEFERRLYTINPSFMTENKIDTEEIYAYLNEYAQILLEKAAEYESQGKPDDYGLIVSQSLMPIGNNFPEQMDNVLIFGKECVSFRIKNCFRVLGGSVTKYIYDGVREDMDIEHYHDHGKTGDKHGPVILSHFSQSSPIVIYNTKDLQKVLQTYDNEGSIFRHNPATIWQKAGYSNRFYHKDSHTKIYENTIPDYTYIYVFDGALDVVDLRGSNGEDPPNNTIPGVQLQLRYIPLLPYFEITLENKEMCQLPMSCFHDLVEGAVQLYIERAMSTRPSKQENQQPKQSAEQ